MLTVAEVMTRNVLFLQTESSLREAIDTLASRHVSGAPVLDACGRLSGVLAASDILQAESEDMHLDRTTVGEVMSRPTFMVRPETELREAALAMEYADVHRLFVEDQGKLVGVISRTDVSRALASGKI